MDSWFPTFQRMVNREVPVPALWPRAVTLEQRHSLLRLIALAAEENLPLPQLIANWAEDKRGVQRSRLRKLAALLKGGRPLPDAIEEVSGILKDDDLLAIRFDSQMGTRTAAVRQMLRQGETAAASATRRVRGDLVYFVTVFVVAIFLITF